MIRMMFGLASARRQEVINPGRARDAVPRLTVVRKSRRFIIVSPSFKKTVIKSHIVGQQEHRPAGQPAAIAPGVQPPGIVVPVAEVALLNGQHLAAYPAAPGAAWRREKVGRAQYPDDGCFRAPS